MTPEVADYLRMARAHLVKARNFLDFLHYGDEASRAAYLAGLNAAQALIFTRDGRATRTHRGLRASFARLARDEPSIDPEFVGFLGRAYRFKEITDYGMDSEAVVTEADAREMIDIAARFIDRIAEILA